MSTTIYATATGYGKWSRRPARSFRIDGQTANVTAYALTDRPSDWIAHRHTGNVKGWTVTHEPTGLGLPTPWGMTLDAAKSLILSLTSNETTAKPEALAQLPYGQPPAKLSPTSPAKLELIRVRHIFQEWRELQREQRA